MFFLWKTEFDNACRTSYITEATVNKNYFAHYCNMYLHIKKSYEKNLVEQKRSYILTNCPVNDTDIFPKYETTVFPNSSLFTQLNTISDKL